MSNLTKETIKKNWIIFIGVGVILFLLGWLVGHAVATIGTQAVGSPDPALITSFEECAAAGYPIQESYPEVCTVPGGGRFINQ